MFHALRGRLVRVTPHQAYIDVGGIIFSLRVPLSTTQKLTEQSEAILYTVLHLPREEGEPILYGFTDESERKLFLHLLKVRSLGPQKALTLLSHFAPEVLLQLIHSGNVEALTQVKGIGKKLAQQIILDMQSALKDFSLPTTSPVHEEAYEALIALGFTPQEAHTRLSKAISTLSKEASAEDIVQFALKHS
ncbi:MAG: Holliday junction branch migration protein RuvA [Bacteroidia bacterium]|nr:Holliday junction branch migration protein RuvA [Bacteroidia bacterium]